MRFAWIKDNAVEYNPIKQTAINRIIYILYNVVWWVPVVLPFTGIIDYRTGFIVLFIVILIRALANLYRNNALTPEQAEVFPLRAP
jgi:hypothetical protein